LLFEALEAGAPVEAVYVPLGTGSDLVDRARAQGLRVFELEPGVLERVSGVLNPQPVLAVGGFVDVPLDKLAGSDFVVVCVDIRDPGNLGTVVRSAEGAGVAGVICCTGTADIYNPKCVRASAGSIFHVSIVIGVKAQNALAQVGELGLRRLGCWPAGGTSLYDLDMTVPVAVVVGNEANGLGPELECHLDARVTVPMVGRTESLNVGMTAAVVVFEVARQRAMYRPTMS